MIKYLHSFKLFVLLVSIFAVTAVINSQKRNVLATFQCCNLPSECYTQQCNPCYAGDEGQLRIAGQYYHGIRAGYSQACSSPSGSFWGWKISAQGGNCTPGFSLCTIWEQCQCAGSPPSCYCGDGSCNCGETSSSCPGDCGGGGPGNLCNGGCSDSACNSWCKSGGCGCGTCNSRTGICRCWKACVGGPADNNGCNNSCAPT